MVMIVDRYLNTGGLVLMGFLVALFMSFGGFNIWLSIAAGVGTVFVIVSIFMVTFFFERLDEKHEQKRLEESKQSVVFE